MAACVASAKLLLGVVVINCRIKRRVAVGVAFARGEGAKRQGASDGTRRSCSILYASDRGPLPKIARLGVW